VINRLEPKGILKTKPSNVLLMNGGARQGRLPAPLYGTIAGRNGPQQLIDMLVYEEAGVKCHGLNF
jgi:hypothetical protein